MFIEGLRLATAAQPFQLTTDGLSPYLGAIDSTLSDRVDYAMLIKAVCRKPGTGEAVFARFLHRLQEAPCHRRPGPDMVSTSHSERQNLTMRTQIKRLARLTLELFKEVGKLVVRDCAALCLLQLLPHPPDSENHTGNGIKPHGSHLDDHRAT